MISLIQFIPKFSILFFIDQYFFVCTSPELFARKKYALHFSDWYFFSIQQKITIFLQYSTRWGQAIVHRTKNENFLFPVIYAFLSRFSDQHKKRETSKNDTHKNNNKLAQHNVDISNWNWYSATCMHTQKGVKCNLNSIPDMLAHPPTSVHPFSFLFSFWNIFPSHTSDAIAVDSIYFFLFEFILFLVEMRFVVF